MIFDILMLVTMKTAVLCCLVEIYRSFGGSCRFLQNNNFIPVCMPVMYDSSFHSQAQSYFAGHLDIRFDSYICKCMSVESLT